MNEERLREAQYMVSNAQWHGRKPIAAAYMGSAIQDYPEHDLAICLWWGSPKQPLMAGMDWLGKVTPAEHGICAVRIIEPALREKVVFLPADTVVMVFKPIED